MPRKPKVEKQTITVIVNGKPVAVILHPPTATRKSWYAYWPGLVTSKSTGRAKFEDAVVVVEAMVKGGGKKTILSDALLTDDEFEQIQKAHFGRHSDARKKARAQKSLLACLEAIAAFRDISGLKPVTAATADDCAAFQRKALALPKNWRHLYPNSQKGVDCLSSSTVKKWSGALQAAFERVNRNAGKKCVRGVVDDRKLLADNPWKHFTGVEGKPKPLRQFDSDELLGFLDHLAIACPAITVGPLLAKVCLWSWDRREEVTGLAWSMLRIVGDEHHFEVIGKWGVKKWFRIPASLYRELLAVRTESPFVFTAYSDQVRRSYEESETPGPAKNVLAEFRPENLANWFHNRLVKWSKSLPRGRATMHVFRKTGLQYARTGEDVNREVAADAHVGEGVMMTHYVEESDLHLRQASNRTFRRILASLPPKVAERYGNSDQPQSDVEERIRQAVAARDWAAVTRLSAELNQEPQTAKS